MLGPVFDRQRAVLPRQPRSYATRAGYGGCLFVLTCTAWMLVAGSGDAQTLGELADFGGNLLPFLAHVQLVLAMLFSALLAAGAVCQEKDRRTLPLLLLSELTSFELVFGKLLASLLEILVMLVAAIPVFVILLLLGGISLQQVLGVAVVTIVAAMAAGSLGNAVAFWRHKTYQSLALTGLLLAIWLVGSEATPTLRAFSPLDAMHEAVRPFGELNNVIGFAFVLLGSAVCLNIVVMQRVRAWNSDDQRNQDEQATFPLAEWLGFGPRLTPDEIPETELSASRSARSTEASEPDGESAEEEQPSRQTRTVWENPILWREVCTWAAGRKVILVRLIYWLIACGCAIALVWQAQTPQGLGLSHAMFGLLPLLILCYVLMNASAVTSFCNERDNRTLDLLLCTDLSPGEFVWGKLGGIFYNAKDLLALPLLLSIGLCFVQDEYSRTLLPASWWLLALLVGLVLAGFIAMLGLHAGMTFESSRTAIFASIGTVLFLFLGVATCIWMLIVFQGNFEVQLLPFVTFLLGGGVGLFSVLGFRNHSTALGIASFGCPFATFYSVTTLLLDRYRDQDHTLEAALVATAAYGFATAAMMVPAISEFDVALGRTTRDDD